MYKSKKWARILPLVLLGLFSFSFLTLLIPQKAIAAGEKYVWSNKNTIIASGGSIKGTSSLSKLSGNTFASNTGFIEDQSGCKLNIELAVNGSDPGKGTVVAGPPSVISESCSQSVLSSYDKNVSISNTDRSDDNPTTDSFDNKKQEIAAVVPSDMEFPGQSDVITLHKGDENGKIITRKTATTAFESSGKKGFSAIFDNLDLGTKYTACSGKLNVCKTFTRSSDAVAIAGTQRTLIEGQGISKEDAARTCESEGGSFAWALCPLLAILDGGIYLLTSGVESLLEVDESKYNDPSLVQTWRVMRNVALLILVPLMLLMVIGTALEFGPFDAYTVKKALPRMMVAAVFITLSLPITQFLINISNIVGRGIQGLVLSASSSPTSLLDLYSSNENLLFSSLVIGGGLVAVGVGSITLGIIGSLALVTFVALLLGYVILVIRELLILVLMLVAPLAILVWIFPGNDKLWTIWKTTFTALLMMFPIIMLLIASGKVFAGVLGETESNFTAFFFKIIALVAPFFFIPATFKYGLGVFGNIAGMVNDRGRGIFDRQRKFREGNREKYRQRAREGNRFAGGNSTNWRGKLNRGISGGINAPGAILDSGNLMSPGLRGQNWRSATRTAMSSANAAAIERTMKEDRNYQPWANNDALNKAAAETNNANELRENLVNNYGYHEGSKQLEDAVTDVEKVRRTMNPEAFRQMTTLQAIAGGTAYKGSGEVAAAIGRAAGNDDNARAWMVAQGRSAALKSGRIDHGGMGFGDLFNESGQMAQLINRGETIDDSVIQASTDRLSARVYESQGGGSLVHASMKPESVKQIAPAAVAATASALASGDSRLGVQSLASLAATQDGLSGSSPEKARIWADGVMNENIDIGSLNPEMRELLAPAINAPTVGPDGRQITGPRGSITYREAVESLRSNSAFNEMRREYSSSIAAQASRSVPPGVEAGAMYEPNNPNK
jgi:hypothetical protein